MKKSLFFLALLISFISYSQDKIVFKDKPDTVYCKIKSVTPTNIFYIEKGEHKSEYMRNVAFHSGGQTNIITRVSNKIDVPKEKNTQDGSLVTKRQNTTQILGVIKIRGKYPVAPEGYELSFVYTLPQTGFLLFIGNEPTFYVYKKTN